MRVLIVGAGFSGLGLAFRLRQRGHTDFTILERAADLGGTWRDNAYPGCACDVPSNLYSLSFAPNPRWTRAFSSQAEIWEYLRDVARQHDLERFIEYETPVTGAAWDEGSRTWHVETPRGTRVGDALVLGTGPLSEPALPDIPGLADFTGPRFHSAQWDHDVPLARKRVAVIGTGASAIQFIPRIQPAAAQLHVFQRTPPWVLPRHDHAVPAWQHTLFSRLPLAQLAVRALLYGSREVMFLPFRHPWIARLVATQARRHLRAQVDDPALRARLTPTYDLGCKRVLLSDDYYPAMAQPNVELVTDRVTRVTDTGVETADGRHREVDAIILGTGFRVTDPPLAPVVHGRGATTLADAWQGTPRAYLGITVHGFPNLFFLLGPNTGLGHSSVLLMVEAQLEHVLRALSYVRARGAAALEPTAEAEGRWTRWVEHELAPTVWNAGGCRSWYLDRNGKNSALWPHGVGRYRRMVTQFDPTDYQLVPA